MLFFPSTSIFPPRVILSFHQTKGIACLLAASPVIRPNMSDPLSIAGTAVGITSLGIQVCQGLVGYLRSVRGRRAEIAEDLSEVQTLITIFYSLNYILPKIDQTRCAEATTIRRYLEECEGKLLELQQLLIKLRGPQQSTTNREKMREAGRTFIYPFRVDTLKSLRQSLRSLLDNLNLAIDIKSLSVHFVAPLVVHI